MLSQHLNVRLKPVKEVAASSPASLLKLLGSIWRRTTWASLKQTTRVRRLSKRTRAVLEHRRAQAVHAERQQWFARTGLFVSR